MPLKKRIWILEDDPGCNFVYEEILNSYYDLYFFQTLSSFKEKVLTLSQTNANGPILPHLILADLKMPDGNFMELIAAPSRKYRLDAPFIVVSSVDDIEALRICLDQGALDYLAKPFKKNELLVKIERTFKLVEHEKVREQQRQTYTAFINRHLYQTEFSDLTNKEAKILSLFLNAQNHRIHRKDIVETIWNNVQVHPKTLDVHIYNLRKKLLNKNMSIVAEGNGQWILVTSSKKI